MNLSRGITSLFFSLLLCACGGGGSADAPARSTSSSVLAAATAQINYTDAVQELYLAYFGRAADPDGLANFSAQMAALGAPSDIQVLNAAYSTNPGIRSLVDAFGDSAESQALYGSGDTAAFVTAIYNNMLSRAPKAEGLAFWVDAINNGSLTKGRACLAILSGALANATPQGVLDSDILLKRVSLSDNFTASLASTGKTSLYSGKSAAASVRAMLGKITATTDVNQFQSIVDAEIGTLTTDYSPIAEIAGPSSVITGTPVMLDGSGSTDPQKFPISYLWAFVSKPAGSNGTLSGSNSFSPSFYADLAGTYVVSLTVSSGGQSSTTTVAITATAAPSKPTAPTGATAICNDGTYSYSASRSGTCSHHGGVRIWL